MIFQILDHPTTKIKGTLFNLTAHDSGYPYWVPFIQQYFDDIGIEIRKVEFHLLDLTKPWILSLPPNNWDWPDFNGELLDLFETDVAEELVNGKGYLLINHEAESFTKVFFEDLYRVLKTSRLPAKKIIYMVGAIDPEVSHKKFVNNYDIPPKNQISNIISSHHVHRRTFPYFDSVIKTQVVEKKERKFLSLNRVPKLHRVTLVSLLAKHNLLEHGYISLGLYPSDLKGTSYPGLNEIPNCSYYKEDILEGFNKIVNNLPLQIDEVNLKENQYSVQSLPSEFYDKTYFSIVSSTFAFAYQEPCVGFTEKEMRPIMFKQPFLIHNLPGALKNLRKMGFLTFDKWFDESYDEETNDLVRLNKIVLETKRLCMLTDDQWDNILKEMTPVLLHNYNILIKYNKEHIFFNSDLKNLIHYAA